MNLHDNRLQAGLGCTLFGRVLHRVSAECDVRGAPSARLLERVDFDLEGRRPEFTLNIDTGEWADTFGGAVPHHGPEQPSPPRHPSS
ncbi:GNAT family protein [Streptomyces sp. NPDC048483]|uniref:GNAT family protein n=1 Tax=Streptomyces sp. NPDC048483 TaxID=3154927 RepID=UPI0034411996